ncbi:MAG: hypothetical protein HWQ38_37785 [Nostoc sp. NMS7]|uniref:hypothetical protein n=1 Tax=Nostoc sp. NMS7 TaxID=2815391 RepID=UPI0025FD41C3|nr:hypothetical protein [Nostoc sp. NMS7]MBN3951909.1 hypothetical protein [Nostoc sp. NMS7]
MDILSSYLYARPSFIEGVARIVDFGNTLQVYNTSLSPGQADYLALLSDWVVVGNDLQNAMAEFKEVESQINDTLIAQARKALAEAQV